MFNYFVDDAAYHVTFNAILVYVSCVQSQYIFSCFESQELIYLFKYANQLLLAPSK